MARQIATIRNKTANSDRYLSVGDVVGARYGQSHEKRGLRGEPVEYELREEPQALRLACLPLCDQPNRSVHVQVGIRHPHQHGGGIADEARQYRHHEPLPYSNDLRLGVSGPEWNPRGAHLTLAGPGPFMP